MKITFTNCNQNLIHTPSTRGVAQKSKLWYPGTDITIKFIDGSLEMQNEVKAIAAEWLKHASIDFSYVTNPAEEADIRITFDKAE